MPHISAMAIVLFLLLVIPATIDTARLWLNCHNNIAEWAEPGSPVDVNHKRFLELFGNLETVAVTWSGSTLDDERIDRFAKTLEESDQGRYFHQITTSKQLLADLQAEPLSLDYAEARSRLTPWAIGKNGEDAWVGAVLSTAGIENRYAAMEMLRDVAAKVGLGRDEIQLAGYGYWLSEVDRMAVSSPMIAIPFVILLVIILLRVSLRSWRLSFAILTISLGAALITTASIHWTGVRMNAVLSTLPTLVFLIGVSNCLHMANHMLSSGKENSLDAMRYAFRIAWRPTFFSGLTTSLGLISLLASQTLPIRQFGMFGTLGIMTSTMLTLLVFPGMGSPRLWPNGRWQRLTQASENNAVHRGWQLWNLGIDRSKLLIVLLAVIVLATMSFGLDNIKTSVQPDAFFRQESPQLNSAINFEKQFCGLDSFEIVIDFEDLAATRMIDRFMVVDAVHQHLAEVEGIQTTISAKTFAPEVSRGGGFKAISQRAVLNDYLENNSSELVDWKLLATESETESWLISLRVSSFADFMELTRRVAACLDTHLEKESALVGAKASWWNSGSGEMFAAVEKQFLRDLIRTYLTGFVVVSLTVTLLLRSLAAGILAMLPNILPAVMVLGTVGLFGLTLEVGSIMTASVALGIAVDDTLHFLAWVRRELTNGIKPREATLATFQHCGKAMMQTSLICGAGTAILAICTFLPTVRFGLLLSAMLVAALVADLLVLPAIVLLSPKIWREKVGSVEDVAD